MPAGRKTLGGFMFRKRIILLNYINTYVSYINTYVSYMLDKYT